MGRRIFQQHRPYLKGTYLRDVMDTKVFLSKDVNENHRYKKDKVYVELSYPVEVKDLIINLITHHVLEQVEIMALKNSAVLLSLLFLLLAKQID